MPPQKEPLSRQAKSTHPHVLAKYLKEKQPKVANLLCRLPASVHVIDIYETCDSTEYNATGPLRYKYELYIYYANKEPTYTYHTYDINVKHPNPEQEEYALESKQHKVALHTSTYKRLKPLCEIKETRLEMSNRFALLADDDE